ncbi:unnamed protein product, partial [Symbiodinium necroappetens]
SIPLPSPAASSHPRASLVHFRLASSTVLILNSRREMIGQTFSPRGICILRILSTTTSLFIVYEELL